MQDEQWIIMQSALTVANFKERERELGTPPKWEQLEPGCYDPEIRLILRDLWKSLIIGEFAKIIQYFAGEISLTGIYRGVMEYGKNTIRLLKKENPDTSFENLYEELFTTESIFQHNFNLFTRELGSEQRKQLKEELKAFLYESPTPDVSP